MQDEEAIGEKFNTGQHQHEFTNVQTNSIMNLAVSDDSDEEPVLSERQLNALTIEEDEPAQGYRAALMQYEDLDQEALSSSEAASEVGSDESDSDDCIPSMARGRTHQGAAVGDQHRNRYSAKHKTKQTNHGTDLGA